MTLTALQDTVFGSEGVAQADFERMEEINNEIGLTAMLQGTFGGSDHNVTEKEKPVGEHAEVAK